MAQKYTIVVTGGHLTPALSVAEKLKSLGHRIVWMGRLVTDESNSVAKESTYAHEMGADFIVIDAPKLYRKSFTQNFSQLGKIGQAFKQVAVALDEYKPDVIMTFGGYIALPVAIVGRAKHIPVVCHEQTSVMGLTNRIVSKMSTTAISWEETQFAPHDAHLTGNPVRQVFKDSLAKPKWLTQQINKYPIIYITGGNQGSHAINQAVDRLVPALTSKYIVIHQTGNTYNQRDYKQAQMTHTKLSGTKQERYYYQTWFNSQDVAWLIHNASLVISRSGANTVTELLVAATKAVLIPLPISAHQEQQRNAQILETLGLATVVDQQQLDSLESVIDSVMKSKLVLNQERLSKLQRHHLRATDTLVSLALSCVHQKSDVT